MGLAEEKSRAHELHLFIGNVLERGPHPCITFCPFEQDIRTRHFGGAKPVFADLYLPMFSPAVPVDAAVACDPIKPG